MSASGDASGRADIGDDGGPLAGRRIVITRAAEQAGPLVDRLRVLGAEPILVPLIEIVEPIDEGAALTEALGRLSSYDWLVITSPNGAMRVREAFIECTSTDPDATPRLAVVGTATGAVMPVGADLVPSVQTAAGLVAEFPSGPGRVLLAQAEAAEPTLAAGLAAHGWSVDTVVAYRTVPRTPSRVVSLEVLAADAVLFASGSAARAWIHVFGTATPETVFVIGPTTAQVAGDLGLKVDVIAADHSLDGLVDSVLMYWSIPS